MILTKVDKFKAHIGKRYPYLDVEVWEDGRFLEDNKRAYVAVIPINYNEYGTARIADRLDMYDLYSRFWVVWKLPHVNDEMVMSALQETERLGTVKSVTWNTSEIYRRFGYQLPPKRMSFVAVEVELETSVIKNKGICDCLLQCGEDSQGPQLEVALRWFSSDQEAVDAGIQNGEYYLLKADNIYALPKGTYKQLIQSGEICVGDTVMSYYASDTEAKMNGMLLGQTYFTTEDNIYGIPKGIPKRIVE